MRETIIVPLNELHRQDLAQLGMSLLEIHNHVLEPMDEQLKRALELHEATVEQMRRILGRMSQWESFIDVVNQLRNVIELQEAGLEETETLRRERTEALFV